MKKIFALVLTTLLVLISCGVVFATALTADTPSEPQREASPAAATANVYLVPGTYVSDGKKVANTISSGVKKLTTAECEAIFTDNAYKCTLATGATLPTPTSKRVDKDGNPFTFNGWWTIVDATITYFDKVPATTGDMFLYADWRADLSQRMDPVLPDDGGDTTGTHYLEITHSNGVTEKIKLLAGATDQLGADSLGYGSARQLFNENLTVQVGDVIKVYTTGLADGDEAVVAPIYKGGTRVITLESSTVTGAVTANYVDKTVPGFFLSDPYLTVKQAGTYKIYIKFYGGSTMTVYMEHA